MSTIEGTSYNDILVGGADADLLLGLEGDDTLVGGDASATVGDTLAGGSDNDVYAIFNPLDLVVENADEGWDEIRTTLSIHTAADGVEGLTFVGSGSFSGTGNALDNVIVGGAGSDSLAGLAGDDTLDGGVGNDTLAGGIGDDTYIVDSAADVLVELSDEGSDTVRTALSWTLQTNFENLVLTGGAVTGTGNGVDNVMTGNAAANILVGLGGNDTLDGGSGADMLVGGLGDDTYVVDNAADQVVEAVGEGTDSVHSTVAWTLGANLERLFLIGSASINGTGNGADNLIVGNNGNNTLDGGLGDDTLIGGTGNDTYIVDSLGDVVTEAPGEGTDEVRTALASFTLGADLERLLFTGSGTFVGTGNELANTLTGQSGDDTLSGLDGNDVLEGRGGADRLDGGLGIDTASYASSSTGVAVDLNAGTAAGGDASGDVLTGIENLTGGSGADTLTGDASANVLTGNAGDDSLAGGNGDDTLIGGAGADVLIGGAGSDTASYATTGVPVTVDLAAGVGTVGDGAGDTLIGIENLTGGSGADILSGDGAGNRIDGGGGNDTLLGRGGNDTLVGGSGTDTVHYMGNARDYVATRTGSGWTITAPAATGEGSDTLAGIEYAQFADMLVRLDSNNAPVVPGGIGVSTHEDAAPMLVDLLQGVWDFDGDALSVTGLKQTGGLPASATLTSGGLLLDPSQFNFLAAGETAVLDFAFQVTDGTASVARTLSVTVDGINDAPVVASPLTAATTEDSAVLHLDLLGGVTDPDASDPLSASTVTQTGGRAVSIIQSGDAFTLDPGQFTDLAVGESETVSFTYSIMDGTASVGRTMEITVNGLNDAPTVGNDSFSTGYATPLTIPRAQLLANDHDIDGSPVSFLSFGNVANGIVQLDQNGDLVFVPEAGFAGTTSFQYTVADPEEATATGTVTVTVGAQPTATPSTTLVASTEQAVSDTAVGSHSGIARFADGGHVVVWGGQTGNGDWDIYARRYNADGEALSGSVLVNTTTTGSQYNAVVTTLADGGFVVAWSGSEGDSTGVFAQRFNAAGQAAGGQFQVNSTTLNSQVPYSILGLSDGGFAVSWASMGQDGDGSWAAVGRIFNADGTARTGETLLNQVVSWDQSMPVLVEASSSEIMAVWSSRGQDGDGFGGIMARRFSSITGNPTTGELPQINAYGISDQYRPKAIQLDDGTYVVAWRSLGQDGSGWGVFGRHLDASGNPVGGDFRINNNQYLSQYEVSLAALDDGGFVAVWEGEGQDGSGFGVFAQRFDAAMGRVGEEFVVAESLNGDQSAPQVAAGENGSFTVSWHSSHTGTPGIYSRSFTRDHDLAPVVVANDVSLAANSGTGIPVNVVSASTLFAVGHPQGSDEVRAGLGTLSRYRFSDQTSIASSGYLTVNGAAMPALQTVEILAEHLGDVGFAAGDAGAVDTILVSGFDGVQWSDWESVTVTSLATTGQSGTPVAGREIQVNKAVGGGTPSMARLADGGYVVTWHVTGPSASDPDIYARRYDASGRPVGDEIRVNTVTSAVQASPVVGALEDGGFVIAWNSVEGTSRNVMAQRFDRAGQAVGTEFSVNRTIPSDQVVHSITGLSNGGFVVGWSGLAQDGDGSWASLGRVYDATGHAATSEFILNAYTNWDQSRPTAVQISDTEFLATWTSRGQDGSGYGGIMVRRFDIATGAAVGGEVQVNTTTVGDQFRSDIIGLTDQTYVVVWNSMSQDGSGWGTYGQRISADGSKIGGEFRINTATALDQNNVRIAALEDGDFVVVWDSLNQDGSGSGIYGQRFTVASGATTPQASGGEFPVAEVTAGDQTLPAVVSRPDGGFTVTWQSTVTGSPQLESRTFANAASPLWVAGTTSNDTLSGQLGTDTLVGGLGNDTLTGGVGADAFRYEGSTDGWDTITDFQSGTDRIEVAGTAFGGLAEGTLDPDRFALDAAADADDRFVFNTSTRILFYDSNGSASGGAVSLAYLTAGTITAADIRVVA